MHIASLPRSVIFDYFFTLEYEGEVEKWRELYEEQSLRKQELSKAVERKNEVILIWQQTTLYLAQLHDLS